MNVGTPNRERDPGLSARVPPEISSAPFRNKS